MSSFFYYRFDFYKFYYFYVLYMYVWGVMWGFLGDLMGYIRDKWDQNLLGSFWDYWNL